ncbi:MAG: AAA family ATPase, partial [Bacteroidetes bacterium]|nr:AAA family ATPase [Bacteroidota bacterium]
MTQLVQSDLIYDTESTSVYKGYLEDTEEEVIIKIPKGSDYSGIYNEYNLLYQENLPGKALAIEHIQTKPALVRTYLPGSTLKSFIENGQFGVSFFFEYALEITRQLLAIHECSIIHKDISPYNIILNPATRQAFIIDFEFSTKTRSSSASLFEHFSLLGNVYYISPEQTGRMNRNIDYRTDYYSLGIVFYEMLTGQLPFQSNDVLELVHCHIARNLPRMTACDPSLPDMLLRIVDKLTAKNAEERYQSLSGLLVDLLQCRQSWLANQAIPHFEVGRQDFAAYPQISQKIVGRAEEVAKILDLFDQAAGGKKVCLTVGGLSGVGKSALISETAKPLTRHRGIILRGKFDSLQKNIPYYGWIQAFDQFADLILTQSAEELTAWRQRFADRLLNLDPILVQLVPKLAKLFGQSTELTPLSGLELKNRLHYAIGLFLQILASKDHPLVLFLDDWQWADEDSIRLLETIRKNPFLGHVLLVAAYRSNEVHPAHPFYSLTLTNEPENEADSLNSLVHDHIELHPLPQRAILEVLTNSLPGAGEDLEELARITFTKTQGNPFFVSQFLTLLRDRNLLWMNTENHCWQWDIESIYKLSLADNVVEIILTKIKALPEETLRALITAAAAGNVISLTMCATILHKKTSELHRTLWPAIQNNCIIPVRSDYKYVPNLYENEKADVLFRFAHDRIQQALYEELSTQHKEALHFEMGQIMLSTRQDTHRVFEAANHLLRSARLIMGSDRREEILETLQGAGQKAYQSAAFDTSFQYLALWESLVATPTAEDLPVYRMLIETAHLSNRVSQSATYETRALGLCGRQEERSHIHEVMIRSYTASGNMHQVGDITHRALKELGVSIPRQAAKWQVIYQAIRSRFVLKDAKIATIQEWPAMTDSRYIWAVRLLNVSLPAYYLAKFETYPLLIFKLVDLNTRFGITRSAEHRKP